MKFYFQSLLAGFLAIAMSSLALASSTALDIDMGANWNCKIVNGSWENYAADVTIGVTSATGQVACPILSASDASNIPSADMGWIYWRLTNVWARVSTSNAAGSNSCHLYTNDMTGKSLLSRQVTAVNNKANQSLRFDDIQYDSKGSSAAFYTLVCTLTKGSKLHGYKLSIKDER